MWLVSQHHGTVTVQLAKETPGIDFEDLDMITQLLQPKSSLLDADVALHDEYARGVVLLWRCASTPTHHVGMLCGPCFAVPPNTSDPTASALIEVMDEEYNREAVDSSDEEDAGASATGAAAATDTTEAVDELLGRVRYGFNGQYSGVFSNLGEEVALVLELPNPESTAPKARSGGCICMSVWRACDCVPWRTADAGGSAQNCVISTRTLHSQLIDTWAISWMLRTTTCMP